MAETTNPPELRRSTLNIANLPDEILSEIFLLLPPKSVLMSRAVCKAWRRITSDPAFLLSHNRRQPQRRLLTFICNVGTHHDNLGLADYCVEALDFRKHEFRSVVRFTYDYYDASVSDGPFFVHAACDGLLLMCFRSRLYLCNPTTRQSVPVLTPEFIKHLKAAGLYLHGSEYRILYCRKNGLETTFYISTVGSGNERCIRPHSSSAFVCEVIATRSNTIEFGVPFLFHGNLHWPISLPNCSGILLFDTIESGVPNTIEFGVPFLFHGNLHWPISLPNCSGILLFDTIDEVFWLLHAPVFATSLLEVDGILAISNCELGGSLVNLWLLQDYKC